MRQHIPNFVTMLNLFFGCCAVLFILDGQTEAAAWCTLGSFLSDYTDGMAARALRVSSPLGKELDSLADVVSFGVVPGFLFYRMLTPAFCGDVDYGICVMALPAFVLSMFSALRLAKFNLDTRQKHYFIGLSTPGCTLFVLGLTLAVHDNQFGIGDFLHGNPWLIYALVGVLSFLLVSEIPMYGLKIRSRRWRGNELPLLFIILALSALYFLKGAGIACIIVFYILFSVFTKEKIIAAGRHYP